MQLQRSVAPFAISAILCGDTCVRSTASLRGKWPCWSWLRIGRRRRASAFSKSWFGSVRRKPCSSAWIFRSRKDGDHSRHSGKVCRRSAVMPCLRTRCLSTASSSTRAATFDNGATRNSSTSPANRRIGPRSLAHCQNAGRRPVLRKKPPSWTGWVYVLMAGGYGHLTTCESFWRRTDEVECRFATGSSNEELVSFPKSVT